MARYSKTLWDTLTVYNPTNMNHIEQGIYDADLREGGSIGGNITIDCQNGTTSSVGQSRMILGNNTPSGTTGNSRGLLRVFSTNDKFADIVVKDNYSANRTIIFPNNDGTLALLSDLFLGDSSIHITSNRSTLDAIIDNDLPEQDLYYSVDHSGNLDVFGGNRHFIFGYINSTKTYGWVVVCGFNSLNIAIGNRRGTSTFATRTL